MCIWVYVFAIFLFEGRLGFDFVLLQKIAFGILARE
jgi:hypothetical protein